MEEKILEILSMKLHSMAGHEWLIGLDSTDCRKCSTIIADHFEKFIEWKDNNSISRGKNIYWLIDEYKEGFKINGYTLKELHQYYCDNVLNLKDK